MDDLDARLDAALVHGQQPAWVELHEDDGLRGQRFAAHRDRIVAALGELAADVEHVGSTAVPGLAAKPITDVQLVVPDVDDEDAWLPLLEAAGYGLRSRDPGHRCLRASPPLLEANVHLHPPGHPELDARRRFRDLLRADPGARQRYEDVKRSLAGRTWPDVNHYADAKGPVIQELMSRELLS